MDEWGRGCGGRCHSGSRSIMFTESVVAVCDNLFLCCVVVVFLLFF